jgi:hypothetical protein
VGAPKLSWLELQIMEALWSGERHPCQRFHEAFPEEDRPAYATVQTMVYRLEGKKAVRRVKTIGNAHVMDSPANHFWRSNIFAGVGTILALTPKVERKTYRCRGVQFCFRLIRQTIGTLSCATIVRVAIGLPAIAGGIGVGALVDGLKSRRDNL